MRPALKPVTEEQTIAPAYDEPAGWSDALMRHRWSIVLATVGATVAALIASTLMTPVYEATSTLRLVESKLRLMEEQRVRVNTLPSLGGVRALVQTSAIAAAAVTTFDLGTQEGLTRTGFLQRITTDQVPGSSLVRIRVRMSDPKRASDVANWLATRAIAINGDLNQREAREARDFIGKQKEEAQVKLQVTEKRLVEFKQTAQLDLTKKDVDSTLKVREELLALRIEVEAERAKLSRAQSDLANTDRFVTTRRSIDQDGALMEAARGATNTPGGGAPADRNLLGLRMTDQQLNPTYSIIEREVARTTTKLRGLEAQLNQELKTGIGAAVHPRLQQMYRDEITLKSLEAEYDLLLKIYSDLANRYEIARIQVASQSAELQLVDPALLPERPIAPRKTLNAMVGAGFGFVFALVVIVLRESARRPASRAGRVVRPVVP